MLTFCSYSQVWGIFSILGTCGHLGQKKTGATKDLSEGQVGDSGGVSLEPSPLTWSPFPCFTLWPLLASLMWLWLFLAFRWPPGNHVLLDIQATQCAGALCRRPVPPPPAPYIHPLILREELCAPESLALWAAHPALWLSHYLYSSCEPCKRDYCGVLSTCSGGIIADKYLLN